MRLLPLLIMVALLAFIVRVGDIAVGIKTVSGMAVAEDKIAASLEPAAGGEEETSSNAHSSMPKPTGPAGKEAAADKKETAVPSKEADKKETAVSDKKPKGAAAWPDASDMDPDLAKVKNDLAKDLAVRRKQLDEREKQLLTREAVLKAAESEIDQKYQEMTALQDQLKQLLNTQSEQEQDRMKSLVRIYEGMKPADAARIFNTLDLKILLDVISQMSERKSSPILAAMDPDRARVVTLMMAQQKKLPDLPELIEPQAGELIPQGEQVDEERASPSVLLQNTGSGGDVLPPPPPQGLAP